MLCITTVVTLSSDSELDSDEEVEAVEDDDAESGRIPDGKTSDKFERKSLNDCLFVVSDDVVEAGGSVIVAF